MAEMVSEGSAEPTDMEASASVPADDSDEVVDDSDDDTSDLSLSERFERAKAHKEKGNEQLKAGDPAAAASEYKSGLGLLEELAKQEKDKKVSLVPEEASQRDELTLSLNLNHAMVLIKHKEWTPAARAATAALEVPGASRNVKALYRRGFARARLGQLDQAKTDLALAIQADPTNREAKRELAAVREQIVSRKADEKKRFSGIFERGGGVYDDLEKQRAQKKAEEEASKAAKRARHAKENEERKERGEAEISYEDWDKAEADKKKEREDADKKEREAAERARDEARRKERLARDSTPEYIDENDLDLKDVRGYKTLADGRKTSYFTNVLDSETATLIGNTTPQKIEATTEGAAQESGAADAGASQGSAWNQNGTTWEEQNTSTWCEEALKKHLLSASGTSGGMGSSAQPDDISAMLQKSLGSADAGDGGENAAVDQLKSLAASFSRCQVKVTSVKKISGEASIAVVRGTRRYMYDYTATLEWEATVDDSLGLGGDDAAKKEPTKYKGTVKVPEISSTCNDGKYEMDVKHKSSLSKTPHFESLLNEAVSSLRTDVNRAIGSFVEEYRAKT